jgi:hypothetical protein
MSLVSTVVMLERNCDCSIVRLSCLFAYVFGLSINICCVHLPYSVYTGLLLYMQLGDRVFVFIDMEITRDRAAL